jgi:cytochrome b involved in lipid metabolism
MLGHFDPIGYVDDIEEIPQEEAQFDVISKEELSKHNTQEDCWVAVDGKVYNFTDVLKWHPDGADSILEHAGKDSTDFWIHPSSYLNNFEVVGVLGKGNLEKDDL